MPRPGQYTRARWNLMQGVMWGILALTLVLAAVVSGMRRGTLEVKLTSSAQSNKQLSVKLPASWTITTDREPGSATVFEAQEPGRGPFPKRHVRVARQVLPMSVSPEEFLARPPPFVSGTREPILIAGSPGVLMTTSGEVSEDDGQDDGGGVSALGAL